MQPRGKRSPAVVSMIMARRGMAKNSNHIRQREIKRQPEDASEEQGRISTVRGNLLSSSVDL